MRGIWWRCSSAPSPMPDSCSSCGLATAPADRMISRRAAKRWRCPSMSTSTPPARGGSSDRVGSGGPPGLWGGGGAVGGVDVVGAVAAQLGTVEVVVAGVAEAGAGGEEGLANGVHGVAGDADFAA